MKILVICQYYWPEPFPLSNVCEELTSRGHEVHVVTGVPNYPMGLIYSEYRKGRGRHQEKNDVQITRTFTIGRRKNIFFRFLNYYSYTISSTIKVLQMKGEYDVVYANQLSPVMMATAAFAYAAKWKKKVVLYCMDLWPASLAAGGIGEKSLIYKYYTRVSKRLYNKADKILISSRMFKDYLCERFSIDENRIVYHPQYADECFDIREAPSAKEGGYIDLMFAGNIGIAQSIITIIEAADILREERYLRWHIVGDGSELKNLQDAAKKRQLSNVFFYGRKPLEEMPKYYSFADAMIVTLIKDPFISLTLPQKVQSYMAAGKPIIAAADGEIAAAVKSAKCGYCAPAQDASAFADAVMAFVSDKNKGSLGENARDYYEKHFDKSMFIRRLEEVLRENC